MALAPRTETFKEAPLLEHVEELRLRIIYALAAWGLGSAGGYALRNQIFDLLMRPVNAFNANGGSADVIALRLTDQLITVFSMSVFGGLIVALPFVVYQLWAFVAPGLTRAERRWGGPFVLGMGFSFAAGVAFAYFVILPFAVPFLLGGFLEGVKSQLSIGTYISDTIAYLGVFGLLFELPITMFLATKGGLVDAALLARGRRVAALGIVAASAVLTPTTDPVNLALMAGPLLVLYEVGIALSRLAGRTSRRGA